VSNISESDYFSMLSKVISLNCEKQNQGWTEISSEGHMTTNFKKFDSFIVRLKRNLYTHLGFTNK